MKLHSYLQMDWDLYFLINPARAAAARPGVMLSWDGPSPAHPNNNAAVSSARHPPSSPAPPSAASDVTVATGPGWRQLPCSLCWVTGLPGLGHRWPCHLSSFQRSPHHCLTYVRFCSNIWPNISLHSRCN